MAGDPPQELDYAPQRKQRLFRPWHLVASIVLPTIVMAASMTVSEWPTRGRLAYIVWFIWTVYGVALTGGAILFLRCGLPRVTVIFYVVVQLVWIVCFAIWFDCAVFGNCL